MGDYSDIRTFSLPDGWEILVGRTAIANDRLSLKIGRPMDFWFHVAGMPGSHVIARHPDHPEACPKIVKRIAGGLAAFYSKAKNSSKAVVHFSTCKQVSKQSGMPAGKVLLRRYEAFNVPPLDPQTFLSDDPLAKEKPGNASFA